MPPEDVWLTPSQLAQLRYTLATVCFPGPALDDPRVATQPTVRVREDDWRQVEVVAASLEPVVMAQLDAIYRVHTDSPDGQGFVRCHARREPEHPLADVRLPVAVLSETFPSSQARIDEIGYGPQGRIPGGFAIRVEPALLVYGVVDESFVEVFGLRAQGAVSTPTLSALSDLVRRFELLVVDWLHLQASRGALESLQKILG